jgi:hypothetical protein
MNIVDSEKAIELEGTIMTVLPGTMGRYRRNGSGAA